MRQHRPRAPQPGHRAGSETPPCSPTHAPTLWCQRLYRTVARWGLAWAWLPWLPGSALLSWPASGPAPPPAWPGAPLAAQLCSCPPRASPHHRGHRPRLWGMWGEQLLRETEGESPCPTSVTSLAQYAGQPEPPLSKGLPLVGPSPRRPAPHPRQARGQQASPVCGWRGAAGTGGTEPACSEGRQPGQPPQLPCPGCAPGSGLPRPGSAPEASPRGRPCSGCRGVAPPRRSAGPGGRGRSPRGCPHSAGVPGSAGSAAFSLLFFFFCCFFSFRSCSFSSRESSGPCGHRPR